MNLSLFQRVLGDDFHTLPPAVQALHLRAGRHRYRGQVEVRRDRNPLSWLLAWMTRLPPTGRGVIEVDIDSDERGESWVRKIGTAAMPSRLWMRDGLLCEQLGLARFGFRLTAEDGAIVWRVVRVHALGVPLPARWFRSVRARESAGDDGRYHFDVSASMPIAGLLVHYRGWLDAPLDPPTPSGPIIVFDGICVLCNGWVRFLLRHDREGRYRFAAMQSEGGRALLSANGLDADDPASFLLVEDGRAWTDSDAIRRVLIGLGGIWRTAAVMALVPRIIRNPVYRAVARNRYRWFGTTRCHVPTEAQRARFID